MASYHTFEVYNENEYFIKFKAIHPYLHYANDKYNLKKKNFQIKLLEKFNNNLITDDQLKKMYTLLILKEHDKYTHLEQLKTIHKKIIKYEENEMNDDIINYIEFIIDENN